MGKKIVSMLPFVFIALFLGVFTFLIPPFQKPDEPLHFKRAFALALGQIACIHDSFHDRGYFSFPKSVEPFQNSMMTNEIIMNYDMKFPWRLLTGSYPVGNLSERQELMYNCTLPFVGSIPQALGILVSLPFGNVLVSFFMARIAGSIFFLLSLIVSYKVIPKRYRPLLLIFAVFPMLLFQVSSVSYDSVSLSLMMLVFSYMVFLLEKKAIHIRELLLLYVGILVWILAKPGANVFFALPFLFVSHIQISLGKKILLFGSITVVSVWISWMMVNTPL